jgi:sugar (pentulose or hexulose) kinase
MTFIAVDLGTSFIKGAVLDLDTLSINHIRRVPFPEPIPNLPQWFFEVDPRQIVSSFQSVVAGLLPHAPKCEGLVMCSQMHGLVLTTPQGEPRSNCITWRDERVRHPHPSGEGSYLELLSRRLSAAEHRQLGNELKPSLPLCYLFWMVEEKQTPPGDLIAASLPDFVLANLSGSTPGIELTNAGAHGALNLETLAWQHDIIARLGLEHVRWPEIHPFGQVAAHITIDSTTLPCYTPVGDHQCSLAGAFLDYGELSLNIATASQVTMLTPDLQLGNYQTRPFFDGRFINTIARIPAGRALNLFIDLLSELAVARQVDLPDPWEYIANAVAVLDETDLQVNLSVYASTIGDRGAIANIHESNLTVGHLFRAAFEHMAGNYYTQAQRLLPNRAWRNLVFSGGLAQKVEVLRRIIAQKFQLDYRLCASSEDALLGLLALALVAGGRADSVAGATRMLREAVGVKGVLRQD